MQCVKISMSKILTIRSFFSLWNCFVVFAFISLCALAAPFVSDPGTGWHIATGQWIMRHGRLPTVDPFLFSQVPRPWMVEQWLAALLMAFIHRLGAWQATFAFFQGVYLLFFALFFAPMVRQHVRSAVVTVLVVLYAFKLGEVHFVLRPVFFSYFFFACTYREFLRFYSALRRGGRFPLYRSMLILFVSTTLWANLHPSFPTAAPIVFATGIAALAVCPTRKTIQHILLLCLSMLVATLCTPHGIRIYENIFSLTSSTFAMQHYQEWQPPAFGSSEGLYFLATVLFLVGSLLARKKVREELGIFHSIIVLVYAYAGFSALRMLPYFGFVAAVPLGVCLLTFFQWLSKILPAVWTNAALNIELREAGATNYLLLPIAICLALFFAVQFGRYTIATPPPARLYPYEAVRFLQEDDTTTLPKRVLNEMHWGGFLTYFGQGEVKAYIDDRTVLLGDAFYAKHFAAIRSSGLLSDYVTFTGSDYLLVERGGEFHERVRREDGFELLYEDDLALIYRPEK